VPDSQLNAAVHSDDAPFHSQVAKEKLLLRTELLERRNSESLASRAAADARIKAHLESLPHYQAAQTIFCYLSVGSEVDTRAIINDLLANDKTVCLPRCKGSGIMHAHAITSLDDLHEGALGILAPSSESPRVDPSSLDLVIVPCIACDASGYRIGYGGGYYDRYLKKLSLENSSAKTVVLCRASQMQSKLPIEAHDLPASIVITDSSALGAGNAY